MKYATNADLPEFVKKSLPDEAQSIWRESVETAISQRGDNNLALIDGWVGIRKQGWAETVDGWQKIDKDMTASSVHVNKPIDEEGDSKTFVFKIADTNQEKRIAFGWSVISRDALGNTIWDLQDDSIDPEDLETLAYKYVRFYRDSGERHINAGKAVLIESVVTTLEKQRIWGVPSGAMPVGWWTGFYVMDDSVWEKVKSGEYSAFSIEGTAVREKV